MPLNKGSNGNAGAREKQSGNNQKTKIMASSTIQFSSVQSLISVQFSRSVMSDSLRPHELQHARPPVHHQLPEFTQSLVHQVSDAIQPSHPLSSPSPLPPIPPSIRVFSNESTLPMRWPKFWSFSFSISPSKEIPGLISLGHKKSWKKNAKELR